MTVEDCKRIVDTYLVKLFEAKSSDIVCISGPTTVDVHSFDFPLLTSGNCAIVYQTQVQDRT